MSRLRDLPPQVTGVLWLGVIMFWAVQLALYVLAGLPLVDTILLATLLAAMPALAVAQVPLTEEKVIERLAAYWSSIATLWILGTISWLVGTRTEGRTAIGVTFLGSEPFIAWTLGLTVAGLGIIVAFRQIAIALRLRESPLLRALLPRTAYERSIFAILLGSRGRGGGGRLSRVRDSSTDSRRGPRWRALAHLRGVRSAARLSRGARHPTNDRDGCQFSPVGSCSRARSSRP